jgi:hypothetical protein
MRLLRNLVPEVSINRSFMWGEFQIYVVWDAEGSALISWLIACKTSVRPSRTRKRDAQALCIQLRGLVTSKEEIHAQMEDRDLKQL